MMNRLRTIFFLQTTHFIIQSYHTDYRITKTKIAQLHLDCFQFFCFCFFDTLCNNNALSQVYYSTCYAISMSLKSGPCINPPPELHCYVLSILKHLKLLYTVKLLCRCTRSCCTLILKVQPWQVAPLFGFSATGHIFDKCATLLLADVNVG